MAAKFVIKQGAGNTWYFNLVAKNGQVIATSESYQTKQAAENGIESVKACAADARTVLIEDELK